MRAYVCIKGLVVRYKGEVVRVYDRVSFRKFVKGGQNGLKDFLGGGGGGAVV